MTGGIEQLRPDRSNANKGTVRGRALLEDSLRRYGAGRSILADKHGNVIAGNKTLEASADIGLPVRFVESDGTDLIVVRRTDLDLDTDTAARELAYADNRIAELDLDWDTEQILADIERARTHPDFSLARVGFTDFELAELLDTPVPDFDAAAEWQGMPEFAQDDLMPVKQVVINFAHADDVAKFARLVEQNVTMTTKSVWYPAVTRDRPSEFAYVVEASDGA